jgi:hypothetical protein
MGERGLGIPTYYVTPKIQQTKMLVTFVFIWAGSILQFRQNILKEGSKS